MPGHTHDGPTARIAPGAHSGGGVLGRTGSRLRVTLNALPFGELRLYVPSKDGLQDTFVLKNTGAATRDEAVYWAELAAANASLGAGSPPPPETDADREGTDTERAGSDVGAGREATYFTLEFDEAANVGGRKGEPGEVRYTLVHRPLGTERGERELFTGYAWLRVFNSNAQGRASAEAIQRHENVTADGLNPGSAADAASDDPFMWNLMAVEARFSDEVRFPPGELEALGLREAVELRRPAALAPAVGSSDDDPLARSAVASSPLVDDRTAPGPATGWRGPSRETLFMGRPVPVAVKERAGPSPTAASPGPPEPGGGAAVAAPAERWLYVFGLEPFAPEYNATSVYYSSDPGLGAGRNPINRVASLVGVWRVSGDGTYQQAAYAPEPGPDDVAEVLGGASRFVLLDAGLPKAAHFTAYAHVSDRPLPYRRVEDLALRLDVVGGERQTERLGTLADEDPSALTPFDLVPYVATPPHKFYQRLHVSWEGTAWAWTLPDPARVTARLAALAERELEVYRAWTAAASAVTQHSGLVAATCYLPAHARDHLREDLSASQPRPAPPTVPLPYYGMINVPSTAPVPAPPGEVPEGIVDAWRGFAPLRDEATAPPGSAEIRGRADAPDLRHFQYGAYRQQSYLRHRVDVAGARLAAWVGSRSFGEYLRDLALARLEGAETDEAADAVARALKATAAAGGGAAVLLAWLDEAGVLDRVAGLGPEADLSDLLSAPEPVTSALDVLSATAFDLVWTITEKGGEAATVILEAMAPAITLAVQSGRLSALAGRLLAAAFASHALGLGTPGPGKTDWIGRFSLTQRSGPLVPPEARWRLSLDTGATDARSAQFKAAAPPVAVVVGALDVAITAAGVYRNASRGELGWGDVVASGQVVTEAVGVVDTVRQASGGTLAFGRAFAVGAVYLEGAAAAVRVHAALTNENAVGAQVVRDADELGAAGAVVGGAGAVLIAQAAVGGVGALAAAPAAALGLALVGVGWGLSWWGQERLAAERRRWDPLSGWLAERDLWGERAGVGSRRGEALALAHPAWAPSGTPSGGGPVLAGVLLGDGERAGLTAAFVEKAYRFPVAVEPDVSPAEAGAEARVAGLALRVFPWYLPAAGTLAVSATVTARNRPLVQIRCAVHFVRAGSRFRYRVADAAPGPDGLVRAAPVALDGDLASLAVEQGWAVSETAEVVLGKDDRGREVAEGREVLRVWVADEAGLSGPAEAAFRAAFERALPRGLRAALPGSGSGGDLYGGSLPEHTAEAERRVRAAVSGRRASGTGAAGVGAVLRSGRFTVTGFCVFDPAVPLDPSPALRDAAPAPGESVAVEEVGGRRGYRYPEGYRPAR